MTRAVIFCNGDIGDYQYHSRQLKDDDYIIAADGGGGHCMTLGIKPHLALGDFDSLDPAILEFYRREKVEILTVPTDKDFIDLALAIETAQARGYEDILIFGALGGRRIDMEIGNLLLLSCYNRGKIVIEDENRSIRLVDPDNYLIIENCRGCYLSLVPLTEKLVTDKSLGLLYQLEDLEFSFGETRSLSNEITEDFASVKVKSGKALGICQKK